VARAKVSSEAVVSTNDTSPVLQPSEHAFDNVWAPIGGAIEWVWRALEAVERMAALIFPLSGLALAAIIIAWT
jgi:hypothetical protein